MSLLVDLEVPEKHIQQSVKIIRLKILKNIFVHDQFLQVKLYGLHSFMLTNM